MFSKDFLFALNENTAFYYWKKEKKRKTEIHRTTFTQMYQIPTRQRNQYWMHIRRAKCRCEEERKTYSLKNGRMSKDQRLYAQFASLYTLTFISIERREEISSSSLHRNNISVNLNNLKNALQDLARAFIWRIVLKEKTRFTDKKSFLLE